jgi:hypothetical protein
MIYFMQILRMLDKKNRQLFIDLMDDLSFEIEELGYEGLEDELISEILLNHLGLEIQCPKQLKWFTEYVLENQGKLESKVKGALLYMGVA